MTYLTTKNFFIFHLEHRNPCQLNCESQLKTFWFWEKFDRIEKLRIRNSSKVIYLKFVYPIYTIYIICVYEVQYILFFFGLRSSGMKSENTDHMLLYES